MNHRVIIFSLGVLIILICPVAADEPHVAWLGFMEGTWDVTWKLSDGTRITSSLTMKLVADGHALREEGMQADGSKTVGLTGWQSNTKTLVQVGFGKGGQYWLTRFRKIEPDRMSGPGAGVLPDGRSYKGRFIATRMGDDRYDMRFQGVLDDEQFTADGTFVRKSTE